MAINKITTINYYITLAYITMLSIIFILIKLISQKIPIIIQVLGLWSKILKEETYLVNLVSLEK